jgi:hypothetical protein
MTILDTIPVSQVPPNLRGAAAKFIQDCRVVFRKAVALPVGQALHIRLDKPSHLDKLRKQFASENPTIVANYRITGRVERDGDKRIQYVYIARVS